MPNEHFNQQQEDKPQTIFSVCIIMPSAGCQLLLVLPKLLKSRSWETVTFDVWALFYKPGDAPLLLHWLGPASLLPCNFGSGKRTICTKQAKRRSCSTVYHTHKIHKFERPQARLVMVLSMEGILSNNEFNAWLTVILVNAMRYAFFEPGFEFYAQNYPRKYPSTVLWSWFVKIVILIFGRDQFDGL